MNKVKVVVEGRQVAGVERGGEDLFLGFRASLPLKDFPEIEGAFLSDKKQFELELEKLFPSVLVSFEEDSTNFEVLDTTEDVVTRARYTTRHYGFEWEGDQQDALQLAEPLFRNSNNWRVGRVDDGDLQLFFDAVHGVDGNAD